MKLSVEGREFQIDVTPTQVRVDGQPFKVEIAEASGTLTTLQVEGMPYEVEIKERRGSEVLVAVGGKTYRVVLEGEQAAALAAPAVSLTPQPAAKVEAKIEARVEPKVEEEAPVCDSPLTDGVVAVMPGRILSVQVKEGQKVKIGAVLCTLEAMKMENEIRASKDGVVTNLQVTEGDIVNAGALLMQIC